MKAADKSGLDLHAIHEDEEEDADESMAMGNKEEKKTAARPPPIEPRAPATTAQRSEPMTAPSPLLKPSQPNPAAMARHSTMNQKPLGLTQNKPGLDRKMSNIDAMKAQLAVRLAGM